MARFKTMDAIALDLNVYLSMIANKKLFVFYILLGKICEIKNNMKS